MIYISKYKERLFSIARLFDAIVEDVIIVPSVKEWCSLRGITETSEDRAGKCVLNLSTGKHLILLATTISDDEKKSIIDAMSLHGFSLAELESLTDDWKFVKHLLLHECAHAFNSSFSERQCDCWAFDKIKESVI